MLNAISPDGDVLALENVQSDNDHRLMVGQEFFYTVLSAPQELADRINTAITQAVCICYFTKLTLSLLV